MDNISKKLLEYATFLDGLDVNNTGVQVVGDTVERFPNLAAARQKYPMLDPYKNSAEFTWAMHGKDFQTGETLLRFESWGTYRMLSMD